MANEQSTWSPPGRAPLSIDRGTSELGEIVVFIDGGTDALIHPDDVPVPM